MTTCTLRLLGSFQVLYNGAPVTRFRGEKVRGLLAYLATEADRPHARLALAGLFWPDQPEELALRNLSQALVRLRQAFGPQAADALTEVSRSSVQWLPGADVDAREFARLAASADAGELARADELYRGEFLAGFGLSGCEAFEEWLLLTRERFRQQALTALSNLAEQRLDGGQFEAAAQAARRQLALDPWREVAYRQLIRALAALGDQVGALTTYIHCRQILYNELGVEPDPLTTELYQALRDGVSQSAPPPPSTSPPPPLAADPKPGARAPRLAGWNEAPKPGHLYGRQIESDWLRGWLAEERCQLVALLGIGGVGKTALAATAAHAVSPHYDRVIWRSLLNAPPLNDVLHGVVQTLSQHRLTELPASLDARIALLLEELRHQRCLLVLDNLESILDAERVGQYRAGYEGYGQLILALVENQHASCLLLTSREQPHELARHGWELPTVRVLALHGLDHDAGRAMLSAQGLPGERVDTAALIARYSGNPLALKLVAQTVRELFGGDIDAFLAVEAPIFQDIRTVLDQQYARLSTLERDILLWLAVEREPITVQVLRDNLLQPISGHALLEALHGLDYRSLLEKSDSGISLQNVVIEYTTAYLIDHVCHEIEHFDEAMSAAGRADKAAFSGALLNRVALLKAQAKEYVRQSQARLLLVPISQRLQFNMGTPLLQRRFHSLLEQLRSAGPRAPGYAAGNIFNLIRSMGADPAMYDFSQLSVWQADLRGLASAAVNFTQADLVHSAFTVVFEPKSLIFDLTGQLLVAGASGGGINLWKVVGGQLQLVFGSPDEAASQISLSHGGLLATRGFDYVIRIWDADRGEQIHALAGHTDFLYATAFSNDTRLIASSSRDATVRVWELQSAQLLTLICEHADAISALAFNADSSVLASGGDGEIYLWATRSGRLIATLRGHARPIECLVFSADGQLLFSGAHDGSVRVWEVASGRCLRVLEGHTQIVRALVLHPNGHILASGGADRLIRLWDTRDGRIIHTLQGHATDILSLAFSADGQVLASSSVDRVVRLWEVQTGYTLESLEGHNAVIHPLKFSADSRRLVGGGMDGVIRLWDVEVQNEHGPLRCEIVRSWQGHTREARAVAFSPDGQQLASSGRDQLVQLWDGQSGEARHTFRGHTGMVKALAFSPGGGLLASGGADRAVRLWRVDEADILFGRGERVLRGHDDEISSLAFSPDGRMLLSSSMDTTARIWAPDRGLELQRLKGHNSALSGALFSADGTLVVATCFDYTVQVWDVSSGRRLDLWEADAVSAMRVAISPDGKCLAYVTQEQHIVIRNFLTGAILHTLKDHKGEILSLDFSSTEPILASSAWDGSIRLWSLETGACLQTLRAPGPYAGMNITGVTGISETQKAALRALGAVAGKPLPRTATITHYPAGHGSNPREW